MIRNSAPLSKYSALNRKRIYPGKRRPKAAMTIRILKSLFSVSTAKVKAVSTSTQLYSLRYFSSSELQRPLENVGFIGLGNMGSHMAMNLIKSGYKVSVLDRNSNATKRFLDEGVPIMETPFGVAEASDVVITMLPSSAHVLDVYIGSNGLLKSGSPLRPWLFIDSSTIDPQTSRKLSTAASDRVLRKTIGEWGSPFLLDAPVSGGILAAEAGTLTFMVGGSEEAYQVAKPLFLSMGNASVYCGGSGNGAVAKICNNLALAISMIGVSEAFALGQSLGIESKILSKIFNSSTARCWSSDSNCPVPGVMQGVPSSRNYQGGFASKLMAKDLKLANASAKEIGAKCPFASQAVEIYNRLCEEGHESEDFSCVFRHFYDGKDE